MEKFYEAKKDFVNTYMKELLEILEDSMAENIENFKDNHISCSEMICRQEDALLSFHTYYREAKSWMSEGEK